MARANAARLAARGSSIIEAPSTLPFTRAPLRAPAARERGVGGCTLAGGGYPTTRRWRGVGGVAARLPVTRTESLAATARYLAEERQALQAIRRAVGGGECAASSSASASAASSAAAGGPGAPSPPGS